jgi:hypothetical protein
LREEGEDVVGRAGADHRVQDEEGFEHDLRGAEGDEPAKCIPDEREEKRRGGAVEW